MNAIKSIKILLGLSAAALLSIGCDQVAKEKPYDTLDLFDQKDKYDVVSNSMISSGVDHLMLVSNVGVERNAPEISHYLGGSQKVRLVFTENNINIIGVEEDTKFNQNELNDDIIAQIPVKYIDTKCAENAYGDCTNKEVLDETKTWDEKNYFQPDFSEVKMTSLDALSTTLGTFFSGCYSVESKELKNYKIEDGAINFTLKLSFMTKERCMGPLTSLKQASFTTLRHYSIVRLDQLASPNYKAQKFDVRQKENQFGYFKTYKKELSETNGDTVEGNFQYINKWNPNKPVVYYMNKDFNLVDPEIPTLNKKIKESTFHAFKMVNIALEKAGADLKLELREPAVNATPGDLRYNELVMVSDPIKRGLLGYGPSVANPDTGEIVYARTVMYKGIMKKTIRGAWNDVIKLKKIEQNKDTQQNSTDSSTEGAADNVSAEDQALLALQHSEVFNFAKSNHLHNTISDIKAHLTENKPHQSYNSLAGTLYHQNQKSIFNQPESNKTILTEAKESKLQEFYSNNNIYSVENFNFHGVVEKNIDALVDEFGGLKKWSALSSAQRTRAIEVLLPIVWVPTLIHEVGHNLGLRHNFHGSFDKDNWYSKDELAKMNIKRPVEYSSIMDYGYSTHNELPVMGKYDVAALRFAYGKIKHTQHNNDGSVLTDAKGNPVQKQYTGTVEVLIPTAGDAEQEPSFKTMVYGIGSPELADALTQKGGTLKPYKFCTDENVGNSATCNRFDEGTSLIEVTQHYINAYDTNYDRTNFRNERYKFDNYSGNIGYTRRLLGMFGNLRLTFETYELVKNKYNLSDDAEEWKTNPFLAETKQAMLMSGQFFLNVLTTPDIHCKIAILDAGREVIVPLQSISKFNSSCYNLNLSPAYKVVAQAGKSLKSIKDSSNPDDSFVEIDTRGIWIDKLLALRFLVERRSDFIDEYHDNYTDVPELKEVIYNTLSNIMLDRLAGPLYFDNGDVTPYHVYSLVNDEQNTIREPLHTGLRWFFNLDRKSTSLQEAVLNNLFANFKPMESSENAFDFNERFEIYSDKMINSSPVDNTMDIIIGRTRYYATSDNTLARDILTTIRELPEVQKTLEAFNKEPEELKDKPEELAQWKAMRQKQFQTMIQARFNSEDGFAEPPADADEALYGLYTVDFDVLIAELQDQNQDLNFYKEIITDLKDISID